MASPAWEPLGYQKSPAEDEDWLYWLLIAGRGTGKTATGAHYVDRYARQHPGHRIGVLAPTYGDARGVCVEGRTGLLAINPTITFNRSLGELRWANGAQARLFGTFTPEDVERLRGPQHHLVWWDEFCASRQIDAAWDMMRFGLRLGARPRAVITSTPKPRPRLLELLGDPKAVVALTADGRRPSTDDNPHLHPDVRAQLYEKYAGTTLGRQELAAEILTDAEGALWRRQTLEDNRVPSAPDLVRVVVAIDPSGGSSEGHAECGIIAAGKGSDGHGYILRDVSERLSPERWARRAIQLYYELKADRLLAEANFGGAMVQSTIRAVDPKVPVKMVTASRGKRTRAEPVAALDEQCLAAGSLIATDRGDVPIEHVRAGAQVWTRDGLRAVLWAGQTGIRQTLRIATPRGELVCTPDHPVYVVGRGFIRAELVVPETDKMLTCSAQIAGCSSRSQVDDVSHAPRGGGGARVASQNDNSLSFRMCATTCSPMATGELADTLATISCIVPCGSQCMGQCQQECTSTIATVTRATIRSITSKPSIHMLMPPSIPTMRTSRAHSAMPKPSKNAKTGGHNANQWHGNATSAELSSSQSPLVPASVVPPAIRAIGVGSVDTRGLVMPVFNLRVDGTPEFFANGLLVHNCKVHHVGTFPTLEDQLTSWVPDSGDPSPDRLDARVWAITELLLGGSPVRFY